MPDQGYQPTPEEVKNAEEMMTEEQKESSSHREQNGYRLTHLDSYRDIEQILFGKDYGHEFPPGGYDLGRLFSIILEHVPSVSLEVGSTFSRGRHTEYATVIKRGDVVKGTSFKEISVNGETFTNRLMHVGGWFEIGPC